MGRELQARIDKSALLHNLRRVRELAPKCSVLAMIKANGYGHGLVEVAKTLQSADAFGVASIEEAIELRESGVNNRIVAMHGFVSKKGLENIISFQLEPIIHQAFQIDLLEKYATKKLKTWIKINTGMNRLGFLPINFAENCNRLAGCSQIQGVVTHFSDADNIDKIKTKQQITTFKDAIATVGNIYPCSLANSAAILAWPEAHADWVRPGLMLYGVSPLPNAYGYDFNLKPAMTLVAKLIAIQQVNKNAMLGYTSRFICPEDMRVGVINIGYADGYPLTAPDGTPVLLNNRRASIIGRISMDMATIDLRNHQDAKIGDDVILWGAGLPIEEIAQKTSVITWELLTAVGARVQLVYS